MIKGPQGDITLVYDNHINIPMIFAMVLINITIEEKGFGDIDTENFERMI